MAARPLQCHEIRRQSDDNCGHYGSADGLFVR